MRRLAAAALMFILLSFPAPPGRAEDGAGASLVWDSDRTISSAVAVEGNDTLLIEAGVNVSFRDVPGGENATRPMIAVTGALTINGTAARPVRLAADESLWYSGDGPDCLNVYTDGRTDRLAVRNASFTDIVLNIYFSGGEFRDCLFDRCDLNILYSAVSLVNCTFIYSVVGFGGFGERFPGGPVINITGCRFDGRYPGSHPPLPYDGMYPAGPYPRTAVGTTGPVAVRDCQISGYEAGLSAGMNGSLVENCTIDDCGEGIVLDSAASDEKGDIRGCTIKNCAYFGIFTLGGLRLSDTVIGDCGGSGVYSLGPLLMANCTVFNCTTGVSLGAGISDPSGWLISGNRIYGCGGYAVQAEGFSVDISGNRFEDGSVGNGLGRLLVSERVQLSVVDPSGKLITGPCELFWTDARGGTGSQTLFPDDRVLFSDYIIDNNGTRGDLFPYELRVRRGAVENRTSLPAGLDRLTLVIPVLPDLVPVLLEPDADEIGAGQKVRFLVRVENGGLGPAPESTVVFLVDGKEVGRQAIAGLALRGRASVYSDPWRATPGRHRAEARLDGPGAVAENNETNNNLTVDFLVGDRDGGLLAGLTGTTPFLLVIISAVILCFMVLMFLGARMALRGRARRRPDGIPGPPEPAPATIGGATRIKCPRCGRLNEAAPGRRPMDIKCDLCGFRIKLPK